MLVRDYLAVRNTSVEVPLPTKWVVMIVLLSLIPVYICIGAPLIWCACRGRRRRHRAEKLLYARARELSPGLAFKEWKQQRAVELDREPGRRRFERAQLERQGGVEAGNLFKLMLKGQAVAGQKVMMGNGETAWRGYSGVEQGSGDAEGLVGGEAEAGSSHVEKSGTTTTTRWGVDAAPAYSSIATDENASRVDISRL